MAKPLRLIIEDEYKLKDGGTVLVISLKANQLSLFPSEYKKAIGDYVVVSEQICKVRGIEAFKSDWGAIDNPSVGILI